MRERQPGPPVLERNPPEPSTVHPNTQGISLSATRGLCPDGATPVPERGRSRGRAGGWAGVWGLSPPSWGHRRSPLCPGGSHLVCCWVSAGWGAGPRRASRGCRETGEALPWPEREPGVSRDCWTLLRARLCPPECAAPPPRSQCPPCSLLFPTLAPLGCVFRSWGHFPSQRLPPRTFPTSFPAPEPSLSHPLTTPGTPSPAARGAGKGQQPLPASRRSRPGAQGRSVTSEGSQLPHPELGEGGESGSAAPGAGRAGLWGGPGGWGDSLDPHLCLLCPLRSQG